MTLRRYYLPRANRSVFFREQAIERHIDKFLIGVDMRPQSSAHVELEGLYD